MNRVFETMGIVASLNLPGSSLSVADAEALQELFDRNHGRSSCGGARLLRFARWSSDCVGFPGTGGPPLGRTGAEALAEVSLSITFQTFHSDSQ